MKRKSCLKILFAFVMAAAVFLAPSCDNSADSENGNSSPNENPSGGGGTGNEGGTGNGGGTQISPPTPINKGAFSGTATQKSDKTSEEFKAAIYYEYSGEKTVKQISFKVKAEKDGVSADPYIKVGSGSYIKINGGASTKAGEWVTVTSEVLPKKGEALTNEVCNWCSGSFHDAKISENEHEKNDVLKAFGVELCASESANVSPLKFFVKDFFVEFYEGGEVDFSSAQPNADSGYNASAEITNNYGEAFAKSAEAEALLSYIKSLYEKGKCLSGQMDLVWHSQIDMAERVYRDTQKYPAIMGYDFMDYTSCPYGGPQAQTQTKEAIAWAKGTYNYDSGYSGNKKGIVTFCWHWRDPSAAAGTTGLYTPGDGNKNKDGNETTTFRIPYSNGSLDKSSEAFAQIEEDLDVIAAELQRLRSEGIPVLWRPMHEAAGNVYSGDGNEDWNKAWFWWGAGTSVYEPRSNNAAAYKALYHYMHDYFTNEKGLDNLIWVWNGQAQEFYPGDEYCDLVGWDLYEDQVDSSAFSEKKSALKSIAPNKICVLSETGLIPSDTSGWAYFLVWNDTNVEGDKTNFWSVVNTQAHKKQIYESENVITLDEVSY